MPLILTSLLFFSPRNMIMKYIAFSIVLPLSLFLSSGVFASDYGSAQEAREMLVRAISAMKKNKEEALAAFTAGTAGFKDRDLYVACFEQGKDNGLMTAHGGLAKLVGTNAQAIVDKKGTNLGQLLDSDTHGEIESATYWWPRPGETEAVEKESFYSTIGDQNCLVGYYK